MINKNLRIIKLLFIIFSAYSVVNAFDATIRNTTSKPLTIFIANTSDFKQIEPRTIRNFSVDADQPLKVYAWSEPLFKIQNKFEFKNGTLDPNVRTEATEYTIIPSGENINLMWGSGADNLGVLVPLDLQTRVIEKGRWGSGPRLQ